MLKPIILLFNPHVRKEWYYRYEPVATDEEPIPEHLHPLLIPLVISKIVSYLSIQDLLNFRLVCQSWNLEATTVLRKRVRYLKIPPNQTRDFVRVYRGTREFPVHSLSLYAENADHMMLLKCMSETVGDVVMSLRLTVASQEIPSLPKILQNFRALKELLLLRIPEKCLPPAYRRYETLEGELCLPQLNSLCIGSKSPNLPFICNYDNFIGEIISSGGESLKNLEFHKWKSSLQQIFKFTELSSLSSLSLTGTSVNESEVATLKRKRLRLRQLKITLGQNIRDETLTEFFNSISETLEVLDLTSEATGSNFRVYCDLPQLRFLRFQGWKCKVILDDFCSNFPKLDTVELLDFEFVAFTDYRRKEPSLVKTLTARPYSENDEFAEVNMASLAAAFPNVTKFQGSYLTDSICDTIFKYWNHLRVLCLNGSLSDFGVTGIPIDILKSLPACRCQSVSNVQDFRVNNYMGSLSELRSLALYTGGPLTSASFSHGIFDITTLTDLSISKDMVPGLCSECLKTQLPNLRQLRIDLEGDDDGTVALYCAELREQLPKMKIFTTDRPGGGGG